MSPSHGSCARRDEAPTEPIHSTSPAPEPATSVPSSVGRVASVTATIRNDDAAPSLAVTVVGETGQAEGDAGYRERVFLVTRSGAIGAGASVKWAVAGATATGLGAAAAADFVGGVLSSGTLSFSGGQATATVTVLVAGDSLVEGDEAFDLVLSAPVGAVLDASATKARAVLVNDDIVAPVVTLTAVEGAKAEGQSGSTPYVFSVNRAGDLSRPTVAVWGVSQVLGGAAVSDFAGGILPAGTVTLAASQSATLITVSVAGDAFQEMDEAFRVKILQVLANGAVATLGGTAVGNIRNDDTSGLAAAADTTRIDLAGNSRDLAYDIGSVGTAVRSFADFVGDADKNDYYRFVTTARGKLTLNLTGLTPDSDLQLLSSTGSFIAGSAQAGVTPENIVLDNLEAGTYYVRVYQFLGNINYTLKLSSAANADNAGDTIATARNASALTANEVVFSDYVGGADQDFYKFTLAGAGNFRLNLIGDSPNADVRLLDGAGQIVAASTGSGSNEAISVDGLAAGTYYAWVYPASGTIIQPAHVRHPRGPERQQCRRRSPGPGHAEHRRQDRQ